ncbi:MAG: hypothetical protein V4707_10135 [Pseudomonadota bacterium]
MSHDNPHDRAADAVHEGRPVEAQYVRGGRKGSRILLVLLGGLALVAIAYALIYAFSAKPLSETNANDGDQTVDAAAFDQTASTPAPASDAPTGPTGEANGPTTGQANVNVPTSPPAQ